MSKKVIIMENKNLKFQKVHFALCSCDNSLQFCYTHHTKTKENKLCIKSSVKTQKFINRLKSAIESLNKAKIDLIFKSSRFLYTFKLNTIKKLLIIQKIIDLAKTITNTQDFPDDIKNTEDLLKKLESFSFQEFESFAELSNKTGLENDSKTNEIYSDLKNFFKKIQSDILSKASEKSQKESKINSAKFLNDINEIKSELNLEHYFLSLSQGFKNKISSKLGIFIEGHTNIIRSLTFTKDNKFLISCSGLGNPN